MGTVRLEITVVKPPTGVVFSLQDKKGQIENPVLSTGESIVFTVEVERGADGRIGGRFAMGPPAARFLYICSGTYGGQVLTEYGRRAKIPLTALPEGDRLAASFAGTAKDGGPFCATVRPLGEGWK